MLRVTAAMDSSSREWPSVMIHGRASRYCRPVEGIDPGRLVTGPNTLDYAGASVGVITADANENSAQSVLVRADQVMCRVMQQRSGNSANDGGELSLGVWV